MRKKLKKPAPISCDLYLADTQVHRKLILALHLKKYRKLCQKLLRSCDANVVLSEVLASTERGQRAWHCIGELKNDPQGRKIRFDFNALGRFTFELYHGDERADLVHRIPNELLNGNNSVHEKNVKRIEKFFGPKRTSRVATSLKKHRILIAEKMSALRFLQKV